MFVIFDNQMLLIYDSYPSGQLDLFTNDTNMNENAEIVMHSSIVFRN